MREIKFRAWDNGTMYPIAMVGEPANPSVWTKSNWRECTENAELMQYTGLKDKNGKEIYEGDVVRYYGEVMFGKLGYDGVWNGLTGFGFKECLTKDGFLELHYSDDPAGLEIIGNIYENPELLTT